MKNLKNKSFYPPPPRVFRGLAAPARRYACLCLTLLFSLAILFSGCKSSEEEIWEDEGTNNGTNNGKGPGVGGALLPNAVSFSETVPVEDAQSAIAMILAAKSDEKLTLSLLLEEGTELVDLAAEGTNISGGLVLKSDNSPAEVTINGGGRVIALTGTGKGSVITVESGVKLTLQNITFVGLTKDENDAKTDNDVALIKVDGGTLVLEDGAVITGNINSASEGGGVSVYSGGTFSMKGGTISNNKANNSSGYGGGGVFVDSSTFEMSGGTISGNTSNDNGGGVFVYSGTFNMEGGTISSNQATNNTNGGGVYLDEGAIFTMMSGGTISGNTSSYEGGGVFVKSGAFSMKGGTISSNQAAEGGGGVYVDSNGTFTKEPAGGGSLTSGVIYGSDEDSLLANAAKSDSYGHAVKFAGGGGKKRNTTAGENITLTTKTYGESGGWDPKTQS